MAENTAGEPILIGMNDRLFPANWRPILQDIAFAREHGFRAIQFHGHVTGLGAEQLGASLEETGAALRAAGVAAVMEIVIFVDASGRHESGKTPLDILHANLPAIAALGCVHVHWHIAVRGHMPQHEIDGLEHALVSQFVEGVALAAEHGFRFAVEHNEPAARPFHTPERAARLLDAVRGLGLVWDLNHTEPGQLDAYLALAPRMSMLHIGDTPLPEVNYHLPIGLGNINFARYFGELTRRGFSGYGILEIGGLPKSGGYGRDTDEALIHSRHVLLAALAGGSETKDT